MADLLLILKLLWLGIRIDPKELQTQRIMSQRDTYVLSSYNMTDFEV